MHRLQRRRCCAIFFDHGFDGLVNSNPAKENSHPCFDCQSAKMPLKDLDKLTVVKLRAELIARGLDSKGNKPFLVERLRDALDQEEKHGVPRPAIKMFTSENELGDTSMDQEPEMDDDPVDDAEADENEDFSSNPNQVGNGSNGTTQGMSTFSFIFNKRYDMKC